MQAGHIQGSSFRGWAGKSALELLIALAMLGMILLLAIPNLLPLLRSSGDRQQADALAFFVDDLRVLSSLKSSWVDVSADLPAKLIFARYKKLQKKRYPSLNAVLQAKRVKILQPFSFYKGRFLGEASYGRLWLKGKATQRIIDVSAAGEVCVYRVQNLESLLPKACAGAKTMLQKKTLGLGCAKTSKSSYWIFGAFLLFLRRRGWMRRKIKINAQKNKKFIRRNARGYVLIEAVVAALLLILCVGLVYSYVGRVRRNVGISKSNKLKKNSFQKTSQRTLKEERVQTELRDMLRGLPKIFSEGAFAIQNSSLLRTLEVIERRKDLLQIRLAVVDQTRGADAQLLLWVKSSRLQSPLPKNAADEGVQKEKNAELEKRKWIGTKKEASGKQKKKKAFASEKKQAQP